MTFTIKACRAALIAAAVLSTILPSVARAQPKQYLIKSSGPAVYYYADDGKRYVFPNEAVFKSWYPDTTNISLVSDASLGSIMIGGNVTYRPGSTLIKITTDPRVYAVSRYGVLHWITSESVAAVLYGADWNKKVQDVPDTFFVNYIVGYAIDSAAAYSADTELSATQTPQDNIRVVTYVPPTAPPVVVSMTNAPVVSVSLSSSQGVMNQSVFMYATVTSSSLPITRVVIVAESTQKVLASCLNATTCSTSFVIAVAPLAERYYAIATDSAGGTYETPSNTRPSLTVNSSSDQLQVTITPLTATVGSRGSFSSDARKVSPIDSHKIFAVIPGELTPVLWKDCGFISSCAESAPFYRTTSLYSQILSNGQTITSPPATIEVVGGEPPHATLTVVGHPAKNLVQIDGKIPYGEMINTTAIVDGTDINGKTLALCSGDCSITVQVNVPGSITAFTWVGGKYERSNTVTVVPE